MLGGRAESSCGRGGRGGGVGVACGCVEGGRCACPRAITGGSFAKMSRIMARKSSRLDLSQKSAQPTRYGW